MRPLLRAAVRPVGAGVFFPIFSWVAEKAFCGKNGFQINECESDFPKKRRRSAATEAVFLPPLPKGAAARKNGGKTPEGG